MHTHITRVYLKTKGAVQFSWAGNSVCRAGTPCTLVLQCVLQLPWFESDLGHLCAGDQAVDLGGEKQRIKTESVNCQLNHQHLIIHEWLHLNFVLETSRPPLWDSTITLSCLSFSIVLYLNLNYIKTCNL